MMWVLPKPTLMQKEFVSDPELDDTNDRCEVCVFTIRECALCVCVVCERARKITFALTFEPNAGFIFPSRHHQAVLNYGFSMFRFKWDALRPTHTSEKLIWSKFMQLLPKQNGPIPKLTMYEFSRAFFQHFCNRRREREMDACVKNIYG